MKYLFLIIFCTASLQGMEENPLIKETPAQARFRKEIEQGNADGVEELLRHYKGKTSDQSEQLVSIEGYYNIEAINLEELYVCAKALAKQKKKACRSYCSTERSRQLVLSLLNFLGSAFVAFKFVYGPLESAEADSAALAVATVASIELLADGMDRLHSAFTNPADQLRYNTAERIKLLLKQFKPEQGDA